MNPKMMTGIFVAVSVFLWIFYDIYIIFSAGKDASISQVLIEYAYNYPSFPFLTGFICGHIFWKMPDTKKEKH